MRDDRASPLRRPSSLVIFTYGSAEIPEAGKLHQEQSMPCTFFLLRENLAGYRKVRRPSFWCVRLPALARRRVACSQAGSQ